MQFPELKKLKALISMCHKMGVSSFETPEFKFSLNKDLPEKTRPAKKGETAEKLTEFDSDSLTQEQLMHWSVTELPGSEPISEDN